MSIHQLFNISRRAFQSLDAAMNVVGQNVSNAQTDGYHRRRVVLSPIEYAGRGLYSRGGGLRVTGGGVDITTYERIKDQLLSNNAWQAQSSLGFAQEQQRILSSLESLFPVDTGSLHEQLGDFWDAWSDLADNPTGTAERITLGSLAQTLSDTLNGLDSNIAQLQESTANDLSQTVEAVNDKLDQIARLNTIIDTARNAGSPDLSAEDERDRLVGELAELVPTQIQEGDNTGYTVTLNGMTLVQGGTALPLSYDASTQPPSVTFGDTGVVVPSGSASSGKLGAQLSLLTNDLPDARSALDDLAEALVTQVNTLHQTGYGLDGSTGNDFFDPAGTTAGSIQVSAAVLADPNVIAASGDPAADGDNSVALALADLRNADVLNGSTSTMEEFAIDLLSNIGGSVASAGAQAESQTAVLDQLQALEVGTSGVSVDEEMTKLIQLQQAYSASARVLNAAQQMFDTLLSI